MRRRILDAEGPVTIVALAPQTNFAALLRDHLDEVATAIGRLIFTGGRLVEPDPPEPAEFNVGHDPEAAAIVLDSGLAITAEGRRALLDTDRGGRDQGQMIEMVWVEPLYASDTHRLSEPRAISAGARPEASLPARGPLPC